MSNSVGSSEGSPQPLRFLLEGTLVPLARHLRLVGFDSEIWAGNDLSVELERSLESLMDTARETHRIILHQSALLGLPATIAALQLPACHPDEQFRRTLKHFGATEAARGELGFLTRCTQCNHRLSRISKEMAGERLPAEVVGNHETFLLCTRCEKLLWIGSHTERLRLWLKRALTDAS